jgi:hypothetical protein
MINVRRALNRYTTTSVLLQTYSAGSYDNDNIWTKGALSAPVSIQATPRPYGDRDSGTFGERLEASDVGERQPGFMLFHTKVFMGINAIVTVYGQVYKVIRKGNYEAGGYYNWVAELIDGKEYANA